MRTLTVSILLLITASSSAQESPTILDKARNAGLRPEVVSQLDKFLVKQVDEQQVAGLAAVIARDGKIGYQRVHGYRDLKSKAPMTKDTICHLASMTKPVVAVTAMTLWEEGKFKLDDPISDILPEWKDVKVKQGDELVPAEQPITPRMLMTHTTGMDDGKWPGGWRTMTSDQFSQELAARPLLDQPGTKYRYGYSFTILARYVEVLEGKPLNVVMEERLFGPLKMKDTRFWLEREEDLSRVATAYEIADGRLVRDKRIPKKDRLKKPARMDGSGFLHSTLTDFYRIARMLANKGELDGTRVLQRETVDLICQNHHKHLKVNMEPWRVQAVRAIGFSELGWGLGGAVNGKGYYGWSGSSGVTFWANTADNSCGVLMRQGGARLRFENFGYRATMETSAEDPKPRKHGEEAKAARLDMKALEDLDVRIQWQVNRRRVSGVVALIGRKGKIGYFEEFGYRVVETKKPMKKDTLFRIASMTKPIVAVTAMSLWEEGKFKLDDPISKHLPEWKDMMVKEGDKLVPAKTAITPRHLMTHSTGLFGANQYDLAITEESTLSEFSEALAKHPLSSHPGSEFRYAYSIDILGRYIEAIEGKPLDQVMQERVFDKLSMKDTGFWVKQAADRDRIANVYTRENGGLKIVLKHGPESLLAESLMKKPSRMMGGGGLVSTARDYATFCQMLLGKGELNGKRVLNKKTVELMFQNHLAGSADRTYGLGAAVSDNGTYRWGGVYGTRFWINPKNDSFGVFMVQDTRSQLPASLLFRSQANLSVGQ